MNHRGIVLYLHVHQPFRVRNYSVFDAGSDHNYFLEDNWEANWNNRRILQKVAEKSYLPTNQVLLELLQTHPEFHFSLSITGVLLDQLMLWQPEVLESFKRLTDTGRVEIVAETYHHSLAFFYSKLEFEKQVRQHEDLIQQIFGQKPTAFRNTELAYNNELAAWADHAGYKAILAEGWDPILSWRSPNYVYQPEGTEHIRLLMKNYRLSDDIAFRFSNQSWSEWPLTADKFAYWLHNYDPQQTNINLFMDYETFGEHQWADTGIFDFLRDLPGKLIDERTTFMTVSQAAEQINPVGHIDVPHTITWADTERDLTAWLGNAMQQDAMKQLYALEDTILATGDHDLIEDWRRLQTSDHAYYMCTKWFRDGDVHAYFSPYDSPYDAYLYFCNALKDLRLRAMQYQGDK